MAASSPLVLTLENTFARDLPGMYATSRAAIAPAPLLLALNEDLAAELGLDATALRDPNIVALLVGNEILEGSPPIAQAYAGHQFGGYSPRLGDGRALLLGELVDRTGVRRDVHLKGSGRTPFSRGGDGYAAVGPMLRELIMGEAMHVLGVPTTRALAVIATGATIRRETPLPGAILVRVAASHLRVGSFQYAAAHTDETLLRQLADYAIDRHYPHLASADHRYVAFFDAVCTKQAELIARWMLIGFIHGVMNTDNMTISGETIDYGPCAFMDRHDPATVFSSIDHHGRYAYGNQPNIALWNLARFAESVLSLLADDPEDAVAVATQILQDFPARYANAWNHGRRVKLGLTTEQTGDDELADAFIDLMHTQHADHTLSFRSLSAVLRNNSSAAHATMAGVAAFESWTARWRERLADEPRTMQQIADDLDRANPCYIPRNHLVEDALTAATGGDLSLVRDLLAVLSRPFEEQPDRESYARPAPDTGITYRTFCGT